MLDNKNYDPNEFVNTVETITDKQKESNELARKVKEWEAKGNKIKQCGNGQSERSKTLKEVNGEKFIISQDKKAANK